MPLAIARLAQNKLEEDFDKVWTITTEIFPMQLSLIAELDTRSKEYDHSHA